MQSQVAPTLEERDRMQRLPMLGCIVCWLQGRYSLGTVHHILIGGQRLGHSATISLCPWHHQSIPLGGMTSSLCYSMLGPPLGGQHARKREFVGLYGSELELLGFQDEILARIGTA